MHVFTISYQVIWENAIFGVVYIAIVNNLFLVTFINFPAF